MKNKKNFNIEETFIEAIQNQQKNNFQIAENLYKISVLEILINFQLYVPF